MGIEALLSTQIIDTTTVGRAVMTAVDAAAARSAIGAGTSSFDGAYSSLTGIPSTFAPSAHKTSHATGGSDALAPSDIGAVPTTRQLTINGTAFDLSADRSWTIAAGIGGSTGSVSTAALRASGTGGSTLQASNWLIPDNYTTSPNNTVNHASIQATGTTTNVSISIVPKGTGSFSLVVPDGTTAGGNARGANAVDLRTSTRSAAGAVASGSNSFLGPAGISASADGAVAFGGTASGVNAFCTVAGTASGTGASLLSSTASSTNSGTNAFGVGRDGGTLNASASFAHGNIPGWGSGNVTGAGACAFNGASATAVTAKSLGYYALADRYGMLANASGSFATGSFGQAQSVQFVLRNKTTDGTTAVTLFLDGSTSRLTIPSGKAMHGIVQIVGSKSDGSAVALYQRQVAIKNVAGTTSLVGSVNTIGSDTAAGTSITVTADDTNDALQIAVTGVAAETWRWVARVDAVEIEWGT